MKDARTIESILLAASVLAAALLAGCMEHTLESSWAGGAIAIDGKAPEWAGREAYYSEEEGFKVGFFNDADYLYIYLATWNRQKQSQVLMNGFTVWIDGKGKKRQILGVNYPMKRQMPDSTGMAAGMQSGMRTGRRPAPSPDLAGEQSQAPLLRMLEEARGEMAILGPGNEPLASLSAADGGVGAAAMIDIAHRTLVYELRIPLAPQDSLPFAVNAAPGSTIMIGFKAGTAAMPVMQPDRERPSGGGGMGEPDGGMGIPGGGPGGRGGGMPGGGMGGPGGRGAGQSPQTFEYWAKVRLAAGPVAGAESAGKK